MLRRVSQAPDTRRVSADPIKALEPRAAERLERLVAEAERRQDRELAAALKRTLRLVPWPLRGVARKVLLGE
jgi:hypothetical protein